MSTLLDILKGTIYVIVSLIIIAVLGVIYLGFVIFVMIQELVRYINRRIQ
jgi:fructose-specific phosphotransferase system IIC component